ncbi:hypothetical protein AB7M45_003484 [Bradyrhizobium elkanii]
MTGIAAPARMATASSPAATLLLIEHVFSLRFIACLRSIRW